MPRWTKEQEKAIYDEGTNIVVSAGAGSGKTAVLTERVIEKLRKGVNINELLVLTFTKAAAKEMKDRIRKKIKDEQKLANQLDLIDSSYITTFDSFANGLVKKYAYLLNISDINVTDENILFIKKKEIIKELFDELYQKEDKDFQSLIDSFCVKDDIQIQNSILQISQKLDLRIDKKAYLEDYINDYFNSDYIDNNVLEYENLLKEKIKELKSYISILNKFDLDYYDKIVKELGELLEANNYDDIKRNIPDRLPKNSSSDETIKKARSSIDSVIKSLKELTIYDTKNEIKEDIIGTKSTTQTIINILQEFYKRFDKYKMQYEAFDFNDIAMLAIKLLQEHENIREEVVNSFKEIMIDEYQDTNDIQEYFISLINKNNVYMVGDIKQSIYRFRNANPYIFKNKYDEYSNNNGGIKIDLTKNFRSRQEVLEDINIAFNCIMNDSFGGADYQMSHQMYSGNVNYLQFGHTDQNNHLDILSYDEDKKFSKNEIEAFIIANDIRNKVNNHYQVFDKDKNMLRNVNYNDFAILIDRSKSFNLYKKIFEYLNIPVNLIKDDVLNNGNEIIILKNILKLILKINKNEIEDKEFEYLFISISRSFLFDYKDNEIFELLINKKTKTSQLYKIAFELSQKVDSVTIKQLLEEIIYKFSFYQKLILVGNISDSMIKLEKFLDIAKSLEDIGYCIEDFVEYLQTITDENLQLRISREYVDNNSVTITTIHKSKGLEFSVCYYPEMFNKFSIKEIKDRFLYDSDYGIVCPFFKDGIGETIYKKMLKEKFYKEEISEKIRLFYVALTRAKEKMIILCPSAYLDNNGDEEVTDSIKKMYRSFADILRSLVCYVSSFIVKIDLNNIKISKDYNLIKINNIDDYIEKRPNNLSVKEICILNNEIEKKTFSKQEKSLINSNIYKLMKLGSKFHEILELVDLKNPNLSLIEDSYILLKVKQFIENPILKNIKQGKIFQEYEFIYEENDVFARGIIDLMIEYDDHIDIIDYKLKNIDDDNYTEQLNGYKNYIKTKSSKLINIYLYSIIDNSFKKM